MKKYLQVCFFSLFLLASLVFTQERYNYLAINGERWDEAGPFYFMKQGNNKDAYASAKTLALATGLSLEIGADELTFSRRNISLSIKRTSNIMQGLEKSPDNLSLNGQPFEGPMAITVDGEDYVAINTLSEAFGFESGWLPEELTVFIKTQDEPGVATAAYTLSEPRIGVQENGSSRVVVELPPGAIYSISVKDDRFVIQFDGAATPDFNQKMDDANLETVQYALVNNEPALVITTTYLLNADGTGFKRGALGATESNPNERLFVDFSPTLVGNPVSELSSLELTEMSPALSSAHAPASNHKIVVIDAGHGGKDSGAVSSYGREEEVVLNTALKLRDILTAAGIEVIMTRDTDVFLELAERADFAKPETNLFISIHANSFSGEEPNGIETYVFGEPLDDSQIALAIKENGGGSEGRSLTEEARNFANSIQGQIYRETQFQYSTALAEVVQHHLISATSAKDRGVRHNYLYVLRKARSPAILVEVGFISNPVEGPKLVTDSYQDALAQALGSGIIDFLNEGGLRASARP
ncbi:MAG: N-acetylmuramoyl-L-alanine amidase [Trueperaceae bacterium]|nr:N-acetylmuramoyl-L-alanine amidase [Trueperaceae bacterium]